MLLRLLVTASYASSFTEMSRSEVRPSCHDWLDFRSAADRIMTLQNYKHGAAAVREKARDQAFSGAPLRRLLLAAGVCKLELVKGVRGFREKYINMRI